MVRLQILIPSKMNGSEAGPFFALKAELTLRPYRVLVLAFLGALVIISLSIRAFEICMSNSEFVYVSNAFWLIVVTLTGSKPFHFMSSRLRGHSAHHASWKTNLHRRMRGRCPLPFADGRRSNYYHGLQSPRGAGLREDRIREACKG